MRVLLVCEVFLPKIDGVVIRTLNLIRELQACGDEVEVVCPQVPQQRDSPVKLHEFPSFPFKMYPEYHIGKPTDKLQQAIKDFQPDVVHFINPFAFGFACYDHLAKANVAVPVMFSFHTLYAEFVKRYGVLKPLSNLLWNVTRDYHNRADINLTVSQVTCDELSENRFERMRVWQPAINAELFRSARTSPEMRQRLQGPHQAGRLLLTVSRLAPEKNVELLTKVLPLIPDASLAIVGDGPQRGALEKQFADLPVNFVGYLKGEELAEGYASADAFVYASETETMGNVVLEAMASGIPVIAPRAGGIPSLVEHEKAGLLFDPGDAEGCAALVNRVFAEPELSGVIQNGARSFAEQHTWSAAAARVRTDYAAAKERFEANGSQTLKKATWSSRATVKALVAAFRMVSKSPKSDSPADRSVDNSEITAESSDSVSDMSQLADESLASVQ